MEPYLLVILILVLDLIAIASIVWGKGTLAHKVMWTVVVLLFPVVGMILYFVLGRVPQDVA